LELPFIWGPVGGGESAPKAFKHSFSWRGRASEVARDIARQIGEADPLVRLTARKATISIGSTEETASRLRMLGCREVIVHPCCGLSEDDVQTLKNVPDHLTEPFRLVSIGRLEHWKGFHLGLTAFAEFQKTCRKSEYWLFGDGPERGRLQRLVKRLGIADNVRFWGNLPRPDVLAALAQCDVLVHPSLHDSGGWCILEAMAAARPVLCLDLGGPRILVTEQSGVMVPADNPCSVLKNLSDAMRRLALDPKLRLSMGDAARTRALQDFSWRNKAPAIIRLYEQLASARI